MWKDPRLPATLCRLLAIVAIAAPVAFGQVPQARDAEDLSSLRQAAERGDATVSDLTAPRGLIMDEPVEPGSSLATLFAEGEPVPEGGPYDL